MITEAGVLVIQSGPHKIKAATIIGGTGHQTFWSGPHLIGVGMFIIETVVGKVDQVIEGKINLKAKGMKESAAAKRMSV